MDDLKLKSLQKLFSAAEKPRAGNCQLALPILIPGLAAQIKSAEILTTYTLFIWRRRRDSNPRGNLRPPNDLANHPLEPLGYLSRNCLAEDYYNR
jgi:hypothetical protein